MMPDVTTAGNSSVVINAGSSSVKCAVFTFETQAQPLARDTIEGVGVSCVPRLLEWLEAHTRNASLAAVGHRIVHGGPRYHDPQPISAAVLETLTQLVPFAPNHLPAEIALIEARRTCLLSATGDGIDIATPRNRQ
jgi:acetate kinase